MKKLLKKIFNLFGYKVSKNNSKDNFRFEDLTKILISKDNPLVFDVGANKGQSITKYKNLFNNPEIHSFEPKKMLVTKFPQYLYFPFSHSL